MVTWVHQHKRLLTYWILAALLLKLALPALSQASSLTAQAQNSRLLVICTATGLKSIEIALDSASSPLSPEPSLVHFNAEHCLLCSLTDPNTPLITSRVSTVPLITAPQDYAAPRGAPRPANHYWPTGFARAPPQT